MIGQGRTGGPAVFGVMSNGPTTSDPLGPSGSDSNTVSVTDAGRQSPMYRADFAWIDGPMFRTYVPGTSKLPSGLSRIGTVSVPSAQKSKCAVASVLVIVRPTLGPPHCPGPRVPGTETGSVVDDPEHPIVETTSDQPIAAHAYRTGTDLESRRQGKRLIVLAQLSYPSRRHANRFPSPYSD